MEETEAQCRQNLAHCLLYDLSQKRVPNTFVKYSTVVVNTHV